MDELSVAGRNGFFVSSLSRRSTLNGLLRVMSCVMRFVKRLKMTQQDKYVRPTIIPNPLPKPPHIDADELDESLTRWICIVQRKAFRKELQALEDDKPLPRMSRLHRLTPMLWTKDNTLRIRGRLDNSQRPIDEIHPVILPADGALVNLIIKDAHLKTLHGGPQACIAYLRQRFWILKVRVAVRHYIGNSCTVCIRHSKRAAEQLMGALPAVRTTRAHAFERVGVDFAGPFHMRKLPTTQAALRRAMNYTQIYQEPLQIKGWIVIFVCLATRAVQSIWTF